MEVRPSSKGGRRLQPSRHQSVGNVTIRPARQKEVEDRPINAIQIYPFLEDECLQVNFFFLRGIRATSVMAFRTCSHCTTFKINTQIVVAGNLDVQLRVEKKERQKRMRKRTCLLVHNSSFNPPECR